MHCGICRSPSHNVRRCPHPRPSEEATGSPNTPVGQIAIRRLRKELEQVRDDRECLRIRVASLTKELENKTGALEEQNFSLQEQLKVIQLVQIRSLQEQLETANMEAKTLQDRLVEKEVQVVEGEKLRKTLLNTIIELKGNIRVFLRVKPVVDGTGIVSCPISTELFGRAIELSKSGGQKHAFAFDKVFNEEASQQDTFIEVSQLVQSALDGYKVCIFAYGQTGSGKTYTMIGEPDNPNLKGLIPRTLDQIFASSKSFEAEGWEYKMQVSIMEIYNEKIRDLLSKHESKEEYKIHHHANGDTTVPHMTIISVGSANEVSRLLQQAIQNRSVGRTEMNDYSSRSHFVFTLRICGINKNTEQQVQGVLNLIDLAGSDRLSKSGATGDRLKETLAINKSLSSLKNVISALANKEQYVRFRDSKLTYLLQQSLAGDSKALMFVNISPDESSIAESLESLRFAAKANLCERGRALPVQQSSILASPPPNFKPTDDHVLGSSSKAPKTGFPCSNYRSNSKPRLKRTNFTQDSEIR